MSITLDVIHPGNHHFSSDDLFTHTREVLKALAVAGKSLSELNQYGVYHKVRTSLIGRAMLKEYKGVVPDRWISKGWFPGIWCALFHPNNTFSMASDIFILKITLKDGYRIFDPFLQEHRELWESWQKAKGNLQRKNAWETACNDEKKSMAKRIEKLTVPPMPGHIEFYKDQQFAATVGYSDYMAVTLLLPECIEAVEQVIP